MPDQEENLEKPTIKPISKNIKLCKRVKTQNLDNDYSFYQLLFYNT